MNKAFWFAVALMSVLHAGGIASAEDKSLSSGSAAGEAALDLEAVNEDLYESSGKSAEKSSGLGLFDEETGEFTVNPENLEY